MKKTSIINFSYKDKLKKVFLYKKNFLILLFICVLQMQAAALYHQSPKFTISFKGITLAEFFGEIEKQSEYLFIYKDVDVDGVKINLNVKNATVTELLDAALEMTGLSYSVDGRYFSIFRLDAKRKDINKKRTDHPIKGYVKDRNGEPLIGVTVLVEGTQTATLTDINGFFSLDVAKGSTIRVSYVGYITQEIQVKEHTDFIITMLEDEKLLDEIVIIGYGTQKAKDLTAPISVIKQDVIERQITVNPSQALQGKIAGVQVINSGEPGAGSDIRIRGVGSIGRYTKPLYVVDGVFTDNIDFLNNNDIESITVLKDASSSAIYGVRAANGVIIVTTKKGTKGGKPRVTYDGYLAIQKPVNVWEMANTDQYVTLMNEAHWDWLYEEYERGYKPLTTEQYKGADTDWYRELLRDAPMYNHSLDISGSAEKSNYSVGVNHMYQKGIMDTKNDYTRFNIRGNADFTLSNQAKTGFSILVSNYKHYKPGISGNNNNAFFQAYINPPIYNVYDPENKVAYPVLFGSPQSVGLGNEYGNPRAFAYYTDQVENVYHIIPTAFLELNALDNHLVFKSQYSRDLTFSRIRTYDPAYYVGGSQGLKYSRLTKRSSEFDKAMFDNTLSFTNKIDKHNYSVMIGSSIRQETAFWLEGLANKVPGSSDEAKYITNGSVLMRNANDGGEKNRGASFFGRGTYNYGDKYLATLTFRADGSSKYQQKWGYFPSMGLGWVATSEKFIKELKLRPLDFLKLRVNWGMLGNDNVPPNSAAIIGGIGDFSSGVFGDKLVDGIGAQTVTMNYLKWEKVVEFDAGLDFSLFQNRLNGTVDFYNRETRNMVFPAPVAAGGGTTELLANNGSVRNRGIEITLNWEHRVTNDFSYATGVNLTTIKNEVTKVLNRPDGKIPGAEVNGAHASYAQVGKPIGGFYGYLVDGIYATYDEVKDDDVSGGYVGTFKFRDISGPDGVPDRRITSEYDFVYLGSPIPELIGGFYFGLTYKNLDFSFSLQGQWGNKILNQKRMNRLVFPESNYDKDFYENRWTMDNPSPEYPSAYAIRSRSSSSLSSSFYVEDGSYIRIDNIQLGYTIPTDLFRGFALPRLKFYVSAQRPLTLFKYHGFTPEVGGEPNKTGVDNTIYPMQAVYSFGLKAVF